MDSSGDPTSDDMMAVVQFLEMQGGVLLEGLCRCCKSHPLVIFSPPFEEMVDGQNDYDGCIHCDYMHLWPRFEEHYFEEACKKCKRCGGCETHDCGGCLTREELLEMGLTEAEIDEGEDDETDQSD